MAAGPSVVLEPSALGGMIAALADRGFHVIGPTVRDGAVILDHITSADDLPRGVSESQEAGHYRLKPSQEESFFAFTVGPHSWKKYLHPADVCLLRTQRENHAFHILPSDAPSPKYAFLGVRPCELAAIKIQDQVLASERYRDDVYTARRDGAFLVAVQCTRAASTCFCASMDTGPAVRDGFDIALTELAGGDLVALPGSERGQELLDTLPHRPASEADLDQAHERVAAAAIQKRSVAREGLHDELLAAFEHPQWTDIARRCLACGNCTMVCPTCFCTTVEDSSHVDRSAAERWRRWDSCFTLGFSYIHGGSVRATVISRYRQWLTHKFAHWVDQFGQPGCVGCGRCITWCPASIDITREAALLRQAPQKDESNGIA